MSSDDQIDGAIVDTKILKSKRNSPCNICNFEDWEPGDTKYIVEHWMKDEDEDEDEDEDDEDDEDEEDLDKPSREHLCPECAISRGLDYDEYYKKNQNTTLKSKEEIPLTAKAYKALLKRQQLQQSKNHHQKKKRPRIDDDNYNSVDDRNENKFKKQKVSSSLGR